MLSRRSAITLGGMAAIGGLPVAAGALTPSEQANATLVTDFCAAWLKHDINVLMPYLADTISYRITETTPPIVGRAAFRDRITAIISRMSRIEFAVVETMAKGPIVINERRDELVSPQGTRRFHCVGMFFLVDGKIVEWTDYIISQS
jgi:limonene-1,2-epoxide hydrolase